MSDRIKLAWRDCRSHRTTRRVRIRATFIEIPRQRGGGRVPFTEAELKAMRGGLTAEEYRWKMIRKFRTTVLSRPKF
jgi:hypothetical protein